MRKNLPVTQREKTFHRDQRLISTTSVKGVITYCNDAFVEVSGFSREELMGQAHNLVRHPDVPPAVFAHLWADLKQGRNWMGVVKNRCKNGDHYWVNAFIAPIREEGQVVGFESVRTYASPEQVARATRLYARLNAGKAVLGTDWAGLAQATLPIALLAALGGLAGQLLGPWGLLVAALVGAGAGLLLKQLRDRSLLRVLADSTETSITDPLLARMYSDDRGPLGRLAMALHSQQAQLRTCITRVADSTDQLRRQAEELSQLSRNSSEQLDRQRNETDMVATAVNQMAAATQEVASNVHRAADAAQSAHQQAEQGKRLAGKTRESIELLSASVSSAATVASQLATDASDIGSVVDVIQSIAEQTNLLALNAAIEAARAGDQGRGFAVVADEVRALAKRTADSTGQIHTLIANLQQATSRAVATMHAGQEQADLGVAQVIQADEALDRIRQAIEQVNDMTGQIASAAEEQSAVVEEINHNVNNIALLSDQTATQARRSSELNLELAATANHQNDLVQRFNRR
ncbi:methyl-accepting chemotaxis protein [Pseudomonas saudimassiliensis]|uniref:Methyl-accepting chemotaxis protein n=1 Tax=Pseudomonas saudimassiliensis TaxID=1461581 RepID=A0A078MNF3_9PSED|nr:PAS domain-containing methyl-accepting chemotaxis protein [Pseudomonas saudimassiliensis]CEA06341.1 methyl-accepting chemotaxis protein [Pseudomonas saudimassiliensis]CEF27766.1 methyl-accepting chemotaxis protein [Pseudomonas saudimassiliensis]